MTHSLIIDGQLHAPNFIFIRGAGTYSDADLLQRFAIAEYRPMTLADSLASYAILADDGEWVMLADDWGYTLWHMPSTRPAIEEFGRTCDVFACSGGDCDCSFGFVYYSGGRLVRRYVVEDPHFRGGRVTENTGEPLTGEAIAFKETDELMIVLKVAASLGIK